MNTICGRKQIAWLGLRWVKILSIAEGRASALTMILWPHGALLRPSCGLPSSTERPRLMPDKPPYGSPCNNCGLCCKEALCPLAMLLLRPNDFSNSQSSGAWDGPCPMLLESNRCGLMETPEAFYPVKAAARGKENLQKAAAQLIGAGHGCDAQLDGEPDNQIFREAMRRRARPHKTAAALKTWGLGP